MTGETVFTLTLISNEAQETLRALVGVFASAESARKVATESQGAVAWSSDGLYGVSMNADVCYRIDEMVVQS